MMIQPDEDSEHDEILTVYSMTWYYHQHKCLNLFYPLPLFLNHCTHLL